MPKEISLQAYKDLGVFLWERIGKINNSDNKSFKAYGQIVSNLTSLLNERLPLGYMRELSLWIGVKRDAPDDFKDY